MYVLREEQLEKALPEAVEYLRSYLKLDTSNPPGETEAAIKFFRQIYEKENIIYKIFTSTKGKQSIAGFVYTTGCESSGSIILLNHMDVVPANSSEWDFDPFSGDIKGDMILGRGAIDMKGLGIIQLTSALLLKRLEIPLKYNIVVLSVADEETGGFEGAKLITDSYLKELKPVLVLDEGAFGFYHKKEQHFYISYSQKKTLWLNIRAEGMQGHGACPNKDNANDILFKALSTIQKNSILRTKESEELLGQTLQSGKQLKISNFKILKMLGVPKLILYLKRKNVYERILYFNTISITSVKSESPPNVIPCIAEATLDCRLLPEVDVNLFIKQLNNLIREPRVHLKVIKRTDTVVKSNRKHEIIGIIEQVVNKNVMRGKVKTIVSPVGTDSKYFRLHNIDSFGFFPIILNAEELKMMHGKNERISIKNVKLAVKIMSEVLIEFSKDKGTGYYE